MWYRNISFEWRSDQVFQLSGKFECSEDGNSLTYYEYSGGDCNQSNIINSSTQYNLVVDSFVDYTIYDTLIVSFNCNGKNDDCIIQYTTYYIPSNKSCNIIMVQHIFHIVLY